MKNRQLFLTTIIFILSVFLSSCVKVFTDDEINGFSEKYQNAFSKSNTNELKKLFHPDTQFSFIRHNKADDGYKKFFTIGLESFLKYYKQEISKANSFFYKINKFERIGIKECKEAAIAFHTTSIYYNKKTINTHKVEELLCIEELNDNIAVSKADFILRESEEKSIK